MDNPAIIPITASAASLELPSVRLVKCRQCPHAQIPVKELGEKIEKLLAGLEEILKHYLEQAEKGLDFSRWCECSLP